MCVAKQYAPDLTFVGNAVRMLGVVKTGGVEGPLLWRTGIRMPGVCAYMDESLESERSKYRVSVATNAAVPDDQVESLINANYSSKSIGNLTVLGTSKTDHFSIKLSTIGSSLFSIGWPSSINMSYVDIDFSTGYGVDVSPVARIVLQNVNLATRPSLKRWN